jgi:hypothetical protein
MHTQHTRITITSMRTAAKRGMDPRNSVVAQGRAFRRAWMDQARRERASDHTHYPFHMAMGVDPAVLDRLARG